MFCRNIRNQFDFSLNFRTAGTVKVNESFVSSWGANPVLVVYGMAVVELELRLRFPNHNVSMVSRQNGPLQKQTSAI